MRFAAPNSGSFSKRDQSVFAYASSKGSRFSAASRIDLRRCTR